MDRIEQLVDRALNAIKQRRQRFPEVFSLSMSVEARQKFGPLANHVESEVMRLSSWNIDRADLLARARERFKGWEAQADLKDVGELVTDMAQEAITATLVSEGMDRNDAVAGAKTFTLSMPPLRDDDPSNN
jgi:hypothetical protein